MYISKLEIENYRCFDKFEIELKPLTLIIGENNIGKSNLLTSIGMIFSQELSFHKRRTLEIEDFNFQCISELKDKILDDAIDPSDIKYPIVKISATLEDWDEDQESIIADWFSNDDFSEAKLTYIFAPSTSFDSEKEILQQRGFLKKTKEELGEEFEKLSTEQIKGLINFPILNYHFSIYGGGKLDTQVNYHDLNFLKFELLDALRDAKTELTASKNSRLLYRVLNSKDHKKYQELKTELVGLANKIETNDAIKSIKKGISVQLDKISLTTEKSGNIVDLVFSLPNIQDILKKLSLLYNENPLKIERNGTGRNNLLFISLILSFIEDTEKANKVFFRVVGIEEPESHLHVNLQDHLATNIESLLLTGPSTYRKDLQLLLTSHSTNISTKIDFENTVVLFYKEESIIPHYVLNGFGATAPERKKVRYLRKYFDSENINIFYSQSIVLVEGISEKLLFPAFYKIVCGRNIESDSSTIVNVNGLAFKNFLDIVKNGFHKKCLVVTDSDTGTKGANRGVNLQDDYKGVDEINIILTDKSTFEKDIIDANKSGDGKKILFEVLKEVRPQSGKELEESTDVNDIDIEDFFSLIEDYKSEFAYALKLKLEEDSTSFIVPTYLTEGIKFLNT